MESFVERCSLEAVMDARWIVESGRCGVDSTSLALFDSSDIASTEFTGRR